VGTHFAASSVRAAQLVLCSVRQTPRCGIMFAEKASSLSAGRSCGWADTVALPVPWRAAGFAAMQHALHLLPFRGALATRQHVFLPLNAWFWFRWRLGSSAPHAAPRDDAAGHFLAQTLAGVSPPAHNALPFRSLTLHFCGSRAFSVAASAHRLTHRGFVSQHSCALRGLPLRQALNV